MRIFTAFLVILASVILFLLPLTSAMYDFKTDRWEDTFSSTTGAAETTENVTLSHDTYESGNTTIEIDSDLSSDTPGFSAYHAGTHSLLVTGLTANTSRTLTVAYDIDALEGSDAINALADKLAWIWLLIIFAFIPAALAAIFTGRA